MDTNTATNLEFLNQAPINGLVAPTDMPNLAPTWGAPALSIDWRRSYGAREISGMAQSGSGNAVVIGSERQIRYGFMPYSRAAAWVSKIDANGNELWSRRWEYLHGPTQSAQITITDTAIDGLGNVVITGTFERSLDLGVDAQGAQVQFDNQVAGSYVPRDLFVAKLNADGDLLWAEAFGSVGDDKAVSLAIDAVNNIYLGGTFQGDDADFGRDVQGERVQLSTLGDTANDEDMFVLRLNGAGQTVWAKNFGSQGTGLVTLEQPDWFNLGQTQTVTYLPVQDHLIDLIVNPVGEVSFIGYVNGKEDNLIDANDLFAVSERRQSRPVLVKLNTDGTQAWQQQSSVFPRSFSGLRTMIDGQISSAFDYSESQLALGDNGSIYLGHRNAIYADFGMDARTEIVVEKFAADGTLLGSKTLAQSVVEAPVFESPILPPGWSSSPGPANDFEFAMSSDAQGNLYIAGRFTDAVTFGAANDPQQTLQLSRWSATGLAVAKFDVDGQLAWANQLTIGNWVPEVLLVDELEKLTIGGTNRVSVGIDYPFDAANPLGASPFPSQPIAEVVQLSRKPAEVAIRPAIPPVESLPL